MRSAFRYHGAKWRLGKWIIESFPDHRIYVEPFGGSAGVLLQKSRSYAEVYNDLCGDAVCVFRVLRCPVLSRELHRVVSLTPYSRDEFVLSSNIEGDDVERARRFLVRSFMGFSSASVHKATGFRSNSNRSGSTPARDWARWPDRVAGLSKRLQGVVIENKLYDQVMSDHDGPKTLHYLDPPYVMSSRDKGSDYKYEFDDTDHINFLDVCKSMSGMVVISGYQSDMYSDVLSDWNIVSCKAYADGARERQECLWLNEAAMSKQKQMALI